MSKGIDIPIDECVTLFTSRLWTKTTRQFYGRIFRNEIEPGRIVPEYYASANEYTEVLFDDTKAAMCFFDAIQPEPMTGMMYKYNVRCCVMVNLTTIYPDYSRNEASQRAKNDIHNILTSRFDEVSAAFTGYQAFKDYDWERLAPSDMHPYFLFRFDCSYYDTFCKT
jgi:hypothetical protein